MKRFWVIEHTKSLSSSGNYVYEGKYWIDNHQKPVCIKIENGLYYSSFDRETWIRIDRKNVFYKSDLDMTVMIIFVILWQITMIRLTMFSTGY